MEFKRHQKILWILPHIGWQWKVNVYRNCLQLKMKSFAGHRCWVWCGGHLNICNIQTDASTVFDFNSSPMPWIFQIFNGTHLLVKMLPRWTLSDCGCDFFIHLTGQDDGRIFTTIKDIHRSFFWKGIPICAALNASMEKFWMSTVSLIFKTYESRGGQVMVANNVLFSPEEISCLTSTDG